MGMHIFRNAMHAGGFWEAAKLVKAWVWICPCGPPVPPKEPVPDETSFSLR